MTQLGLYMKDMHEKGVTSKGCFLFMLLSDKHFGVLIQIECHYDPKTNTAHATSYQSTDGSYGELNTSLDLSKALDRWTFLNNCLAENQEPSPEYTYKHALTPEVLKEIPDPKLKKIVEGKIIYGDWQPLYSRYKNKQLEKDGITPERTAEEIAAARAEYRKRHPRSKI
jgi:hypothetical protein